MNRNLMSSVALAFLGLVGVGQVKAETPTWVGRAVSRGGLETSMNVKSCGGDQNQYKCLFQHKSIDGTLLAFARVDLMDCKRGYGKLYYLDMDGMTFGSHDVAIGVDSIASYEFGLLCETAKIDRMTKAVVKADQD